MKLEAEACTGFGGSCVSLCPDRHVLNTMHRITLSCLTAQHAACWDLSD